MNQIINRIKYWAQLALLPLYWLSFLMPRDKNIWLFGSTFGRRFADNPRYLYLYVSQHSKLESDQIKNQVKMDKSVHWVEDGNCSNIRPIWISHSKTIVAFLLENGYESYYYHSFKGVWYALRGGVYLFDNYSKDINFWLSGRALKVNLWHGVGNKRINYDNEHDRFRHPKNRWERFCYFPRRLSDEKPSHYIGSTSPMMSEIFARAFQVPSSHIIETGYPRNDILFESKEISNIYGKTERGVQKKLYDWKKEGKKLLSYIPTFRPSEKRFFDVIDMASFQDFLEQHNMVLVCKLHPKSLCTKQFEQIEYANICVISADVDVNSFLGLTDLLIADYSSVYSDFMLTEKPVVAFQYDYKEYSLDTRTAYFDYDEYMPEVKTVDMISLEKGILEVLEHDDAREKREAFRMKLYTDKDGFSSRRTVQELRKVMRGAR